MSYLRNGAKLLSNHRNEKIIKVTNLFKYSLNELKGWKQKFNKAEYGVQNKKKVDESLIQWAGGLHQRADFNKKRDPLTQWTEVLFHH